MQLSCSQLSKMKGRTAREQRMNDQGDHSTVLQDSTLKGGGLYADSTQGMTCGGPLIYRSGFRATSVPAYQARDEIFSWPWRESDQESIHAAARLRMQNTNSLLPCRLIDQ